MMASAECSFVCKGCTVLTGIEVELARHGRAEHGDLRAEMATHALQVGRSSLNAAAREVGCQSIEKDLPPAPDPMPPVGSPELLEYAKACPSFDRYVDKLTAAMQTPQGE